MEHWADVDEPARTIGIARDVILVHLASMSNLFAASGWMLGQLVLHPDVLARVRDRRTRVARAVRAGVDPARATLGDAARGARPRRGPRRAAHVPDRCRAPRSQPCCPLTNTTAAPGLDTYDPDRWLRRRLRDEADLPARELVTTFGHGEHTCPAQPFSLAAMCRSAERLVATYDLEPAAGLHR